MKGQTSNSKNGVKSDVTKKVGNGTNMNGKYTDNENSDTGSRTSGIAPIPPDGGWGWVITFSSFIVGVIVDGICFTFGIFFPVFQRYFGSNKSTTASINSVLNGTYLTIGPIVGALVNKFGCRKVASVGAVITFVAFFVSTFSPNVTVMIITYGFFGGIGFGLMYLPAIVMVGYYFDKKRALATGIAVCGSGVGSFVLSPLNQFLLNQYNWQGALWILSAIVLHGLACAALFRPLSYTDQSNCQSTADGIEIDDVTNVDITITSDDEPMKPLFNPTLQAVKGLGPKSPIYRCKSLEHCNTASGDKTAEIARLGHSLFLDAEPRSRKHAKGRHYLNPLERKDIFYSGSIQNLPEYQKAGDEEGFVKSMLSLNNQSDDTESETAEHFCSRLFKDMFDLSLLRSPTFVLYGLSCLLCMIGFFVPFIYIPDITLKYGMTPSQGAWVISTIGILNTIGRILVGWVSDKSWADAILINTVALVVAGVTTMFVPFYKFYPILIVYAVIFGLSIAAFVSLRSIIIVELLGIEKLTNSFGLVVLCQGLSTFIGSPIAGALFDATGDYKASFYLAGTVIALSGVICLPLRRISRWEKRRKRTANLVAMAKSEAGGNELTVNNNKTGGQVCNNV